MADIKISYRGSAIAEINNSGTTTLTTGGYYCDSDIKIVYTKPGGGGGGISADDIAQRTNISSITLTVTTIPNVGDGYTFDGFPMETISAPNLTTIAAPNCFKYCRNLKTNIFPELTTISAVGAFSYAGAANLASTQAILVFPKLALGNVRSTFDRGYFDKIDIGPNTANLYNDTFYHNTNQQTVKTLILRKADAIVTASNTDAIKGLRDVYIPHSLYTHLGDGTGLDYQAATNWSTWYAQGSRTFHDIQGSIYENAYADGTPIS